MLLSAGRIRRNIFGFFLIYMIFYEAFNLDPAPEHTIAVRIMSVVITWAFCSLLEFLITRCLCPAERGFLPIYFDVYFWARDDVQV
jgi:hypothetical protein